MKYKAVLTITANLLILVIAITVAPVQSKQFLTNEKVIRHI